MILLLEEWPLHFPLYGRFSLRGQLCGFRILLNIDEIKQIEYQVKNYLISGHAGLWRPKGEWSGCPRQRGVRPKDWKIKGRGKTKKRRGKSEMRRKNPREREKASERAKRTLKNNY